MNNYGCQSMVDEIKFVLLKHPKDSHISQQNIDTQWQELFYLDQPAYQTVLKEYENFTALARSA